MFKYCKSFLYLQQSNVKEMICGNMYSENKKDTNNKLHCWGLTIFPVLYYSYMHIT